METVRKNITLPKEIAEEIESFVQIRGISFSEFLRNSAMKEIERTEKQDLLDYLKENCEYVSYEEQKELEKLDLDFDLYNKEDFREMSIDEILHD